MENKEYISPYDQSKYNFVIENSIEDRVCDALSWVFSTFKKGCSNNTEM